MAIYAIIAQPGPNQERLAPEIERAFAGALYNAGNGVWLVASPGPAQEISNHLGISDGANGSAIVLEVASYYGRANPAVWTWIQANWGRSPLETLDLR